MSQPADIKAAFAAAVEDVVGVDHALDYEPEDLPPFTAAGGAIVTMLLRKAPPRIVSTGPVIEVAYEWTVHVYHPLNEFRTAQAALEDLLPRLLLVTVTDPTLDDTCDEAYLVDDGDEPFPEEGSDALLWTKRLRLIAKAELP